MTTPRISTMTILLVVLGFVLAILAALVAAVLLKAAGATLIQAMCGGSACFVAVMTLYLATLAFLRSSGTASS